jgi:hypothetical protein
MFVRLASLVFCALLVLLACDSQSQGFPLRRPVLRSVDQQLLRPGMLAVLASQLLPGVRDDRLRSLLPVLLRLRPQWRQLPGGLRCQDDARLCGLQGDARGMRGAALRKPVLLLGCRRPRGHRAVASSRSALVGARLCRCHHAELRARRAERQCHGSGVKVGRTVLVPVSEVRDKLQPLWASLLASDQKRREVERIVLFERSDPPPGPSSEGTRWRPRRTG